MCTYQSCTERRRIADFAPLQDGELAANAACHILVGADHVQGADPLAVQPSILRKALRQVDQRRTKGTFVSAAMSPKALDKGWLIFLFVTSEMDKELNRYELLAHPCPPTPVKAKAPPIGSTLADLAAQLRQSREALLNGGCATPQSVQEMMRYVASVVEKSKGLVDDRLKETHGSSAKIAKLIDKVRPGRCAPSPDRRTELR